MGLLSSAKLLLGQVKAKATSSLGSRLAKRQVVKAGAFAKLSSVIPPSVLTAARLGAVKTPMMIGTSIASRILPRRAKARAGTLARLPRKQGAVGKVIQFAKKHPLGTIAAITTAAVAAEQVAEKLGVRGGAGFIGRKPRKKRTTKRKTTRRRRTTKRKAPSRRGGKRVSFTTRDGRKVSFTPKAKRRVRRTRRRISLREERQIAKFLRR